jgi:hypothetical protein
MFLESDPPNTRINAPSRIQERCSHSITGTQLEFSSRFEDTRMNPSDPPLALPSAHSTSLHLTHPTPGESFSVSNHTFPSWGDALTLPQYLSESNYLRTVPLAADGGMTHWVLVDKTLPPNQRPILSSCETFRKRALVADAGGRVRDVIIHGVASVFCESGLRGRGYAGRMMKELGAVLREWQVDRGEVVGSVLYSDIGGKYYADLGWKPLPGNFHIQVPALQGSRLSGTTALLEGDLESLCRYDESLIRKIMATNSSDGKMQVMIVPDLDHMLWHHRKEEFVSENLFGKKPLVKGAIAGQSPNRIWAIWTHRFYGDPKSTLSGNTLYVLRLVVENQATLSPEGRQPSKEAEKNEEQVERMKAVLRVAQAEAAEWNLQHVVLWGPNPLVQNLIVWTGIEHLKVERESEGIASLLWYGEESGKKDKLEWIANEKYAWC